MKTNDKITRKDKSASVDKKIKGIVRLLDTDVDGNLSLEQGLRRLKGIGFMFSNAICVALGIDPRIKIGTMNNDEIKRIEEFIKNPKLKSWLLNRRRDPATGEDTHLVGKSKIDIRTREDINIMKRIKSYKGIRHSLGLPVRGQKTRSSFRKARTVGVIRKKAVMQKK